jgi:transcriptional regulator GlxA family with amidase domain
MKQRNVAIMIFEDVEVLDFAGPLEVFNVTAELSDPAPFNVFMVAETAAPVKTRGKLSVNPNYTLYGMPPADILIIPGGAGTRPLLKKPHILDWLRAQYQSVERLVSVCTGALVLGKAGLLDHLPATSHHENLDELRAVAPTCQIIADQRYVETGKILTSGGVSAGIDSSLYLVRQMLGDDVLRKTLTEMEYPWTPQVNLQWLASVKRLGT